MRSLLSISLILLNYVPHNNFLSYDLAVFK